MKRLFFVCFFLYGLIACQEAPKNKVSETTAVPTQSVAAPDSPSVQGQPVATTAEQAISEKLAAFYVGTVPCSDCSGIKTMLTLNADDKRTFTLEEEHTGKKPKTIETAGTWSIVGDIVTLTGQTSAAKYQLTDKGLISLNADGTKRDKKTAEKYQLTKVLGE